jgi:predicted Fe-Mo cluster-binding NifX family protein
MKIAVSATGPSLDADVDPRFGRCQYMVVGDTDTMQFEGMENASMMAGSGAGISTAQNVANMGARVVITGNCGPNAYQTLSAAGVQIITGVSGSVKQAIEDYKAGKLKPISEPNVGAHAGMGGGMGKGMGGGVGHGMGRGMGRGMGLGMSPMGPVTQNPGQEIEILKEQAQMLKQQLDEVQRRLQKLEE